MAPCLAMATAGSHNFTAYGLMAAGFTASICRTTRIAGSLNVSFHVHYQMVVLDSCKCALALRPEMFRVRLKLSWSLIHAPVIPGASFRII